jgi:hypothetical protein
MHRLQERSGVHPSELAMVEDLCDDQEVLLRFLQDSLAGNASLRFDFGATHFLTRGHAGARKDGLDVAFGSRESSQFEEMAEEQEAIQRESGIENAGRGRSGR